MSKKKNGTDEFRLKKLIAEMNPIELQVLNAYAEGLKTSKRIAESKGA